MKYYCINEDGRGSRRSIADALDVYFNHTDFPKSSDTLVLRSWPLFGSVALVNIEWKRGGDSIVAVGLCSGTTFRCRLRNADDDQRQFDLLSLSEATISAEGVLTLANGTELVAGEVVPVPLPWTLSNTEYRILWHLMVWAGREQDCIRSWRTGLPLEIQITKKIRDDRWFDFAKLREITPPPLKELAAYIEDHGWCDYPRHGADDDNFAPSQQKIADTLRKCGIREPRVRPRRRRPVSA